MVKKMKTELKQFKSAFGKCSSNIAALKKGNPKVGDDSSGDDLDIHDDAGNSFGGKKSKKAKKD